MPHPTRRSLLVGGAFVLGFGISACSDSGIPLVNRSNEDDEHRLATVRSEQNLIGLYSAVIAAVPSLAGDLKPIRKQHLAHLDAVAGEMHLESTSPAPVEATVKRSVALTRLRRAERSAARARTNAAVAVEDGELARLLAQIGSSESAHLALLSRTTS